MLSSMKWVRTGLVVVLATALLSGEISMAKKPVPPDDPPEPESAASTIYYRQGATIWGMNPDGSGEFQALPEGLYGDATHTVMPSTLVYGPDDGYRWWLTLATVDKTYDYVVWVDGKGTNLEGYDYAEDPDDIVLPYDGYEHLYDRQELFAMRDDTLEVVQLTDTFGDLANVEGQAYWSNDGLDTFVSFVGLNVSSAVFEIDEDGVTKTVFHIDPIIADDPARIVHRVDVFGFELDELVAPVTYDAIEQIGPYQDDLYHWGPSGGRLTYVKLDENGKKEIWVADLQPDESWSSELLFDDESYGAYAPNWSPVIETPRIAFCHRTNIWSIDPDNPLDAGPLHLNEPASTTMHYPIWSPDGAEVLFQLAYWKISGTAYYLATLPAEGSKKHKVLSGDLDTSLSVIPIAWVSNDSAP